MYSRMDLPSPVRLDYSFIFLPPPILLRPPQLFMIIFLLKNIHFIILNRPFFHSVSIVGRDCVFLETRAHNSSPNEHDERSEPKQHWKREFFISSSFSCSLCECIIFHGRLFIHNNYYFEFETAPHRHTWLSFHEKAAFPALKVTIIGTDFSSFERILIAFLGNKWKTHFV